MIKGQRRLRIVHIHGVTITKIRPPGMFCFILLQPESLQIFNRWSGYKIIKQNTPEGSDF